MPKIAGVSLPPAARPILADVPEMQNIGQKGLVDRSGEATESQRIPGVGPLFSPARLD